MKYNSNARSSAICANYEGEKSYVMSPELELYTAVVTSSMDRSFYETKDSREVRMVRLLQKVDPVFVAKLAVYARTKMNLRSIPLFLLVELAKIHNGDSLVSSAVSKTVLRADEITELLACYQWRNESGKGDKKLGKLSRQIQNGLKMSFNRFDEYQFSKYDRKKAVVNLKDALFLVHPKAKDDAQQMIFDKIASGSLDVPYTWETRFSVLGQKHFGSEGDKMLAFRKLWEELLDSGKLGYMALLRNLRNILNSNVSQEHISRLCRRLSDPVHVAASKQLPFRFLSAYKEIKNCRSVYSSSVLSALEQAALASAANIDGFGPETGVLVAADVSASMMHPVSMNSSVELYDIAILLSMILKSRCASVISGMFGDKWKVINMPQSHILANTMEMRRREGEVGYSTNGYKVIDWLIKEDIRMDKVMIFTDCQMWNSLYSDAHIETLWKKYKSVYPGAKLYLFDLAGYGRTPLRIEKNDVFLIAGWSDKVFDVLSAIEKGESTLSEIRKIEV